MPRRTMTLLGLAAILCIPGSAFQEYRADDWVGRYEQKYGRKPPSIERAAKQEARGDARKARAPRSTVCEARYDCDHCHELLFRALDRNKDNAISKEEWLAR